MLPITFDQNDGLTSSGAGSDGISDVPDAIALDLPSG